MKVDCKLTGLSGNEIYCMRLKGLTPSGVVIGNSIQSMGFLGGVRSAFRGIVGVNSELRNLSGNSEFLFVGSGVAEDFGAGRNQRIQRRVQ
jgi:hypothetical protein